MIKGISNLMFVCCLFVALVFVIVVAGIAMFQPDLLLTHSEHHWLMRITAGWVLMAVAAFFLNLFGREQ